MSLVAPSGFLGSQKGSTGKRLDRKLVIVEGQPDNPL